MAKENFKKFFRKGKNHVEKTDHELMFEQIEQAIYKAKDAGREHCTIYIFKENREVSTGATLEIYRPNLDLPDDAYYIEDRLIKMGFYCSNKFLRDTLTVFIYFEDKFKF